MRRRYAALMRGLSIIAPLWMRRRAKAGKEDASRLGERYGKGALPRPTGQLIWMHGASVGETNMMLPLIERLLAADPERHILVTSGTLTSAALMEKKLPDRAFHQFVPLDAPQFVKRFLEHWKPDLAIWAESEIWPNLILKTKAADIPMVLINARMSEKSLSGWRKRPKFATDIFSCFNTILPADSRTADGLSHILDLDLHAVGNLKYDAGPLSFNKDERTMLKSAIGQKSVWVAASLHAEEMNIVFDAQKQLNQKQLKKTLLILVPRHPSEAASRMIIADHPHLKIARRSKDQTPTPETDIYLFDTLGEMGLAYVLGDIALVGGSLSPELMGHNPLEPIRLNIPTVTGPYFASFAEVYAPYIENNAVTAIEDINCLAQIIEDMLASPETRKEMTDRASMIAREMSGSLDITVRTLEALL